MNAENEKYIETFYSTDGSNGRPFPGRSINIESLNSCNMNLNRLVSAIQLFRKEDIRA